MKTLRWLTLTLASLLLLLVLLMGGLWAYSASPNSLAMTLRVLTPFLPNGQQLTLQDVSGSLREGGHVGALHWQQDGLTVHAQDITLRWLPQALLQRKLHLADLRLGQLQIDDQRPSTPGATPTPPTSLRLPLVVDAQVRIDTLQWLGTTPVRVEQIAFNYVFDSYQHSLYKGESLFLSNKYNFSASLQADAPMALALQASGQINAPLPGRAPLRLAASASVTGNLAGRDADLTLQAKLTPSTAPGERLQRPSKPAEPTAPGHAMQADVSAQFKPWQRQPVQMAHARWQALNLAALWPQAPQTILSGQASVTPQGAGWLAKAQLGNAISGPWNLQRLPLQALQTELTYTDGRWLLHSLQTQGAGGTLSANGQLSTPATWQVRAQLHNIDPAAIDTRLPTAALRGELAAQQVLPSAGAVQPLAFVLNLQNRTDTAPKPGDGNASFAALRLQQVTARGTWMPPTLRLDALQIDAQDAQLVGPLQVNTASRAVRGQLDLRLPGLRAAWQGQLGPTDGQGTLSLQLTDAARTSQWLSRWPALARALGGHAAGDAAFNAQWHGGWQHDWQAMQVQGQLRSRRFSWAPDKSTATTGTASPTDKAITLRETQLDLGGTPAGLSLRSSGEITAQGQRLRWQTQVLAARQPAGDWQTRIDDAQLALLKPSTSQAQATGQSRQDATWRLALDTTAANGLLLRWQPGAGAGQWTLSPGRARVDGPVAGSASLRWETTQWSPSGWQSTGQIDHLPLLWLDAVANRSLSDLGLHTDMLLSGQWEARQTTALHASITLERSRGDLFLQNSDSVQAAMAADMREAWLQVNLDDANLAANLRWDSLRAGRALVAFSTQVQTADGSWSWDDNVPVAASVQLQLPPMDVWSALAPPGWRLRGTVESHVDLTGTLRHPAWSGRLQARDLALRSAVDGIDFRQGQLDATLHDQQLDLHAFTLRGAGSGKTDGGQVTLSGSVFWQPGPAESTLRQHIRMALQADLRSLRLSTRPDRRLVASGKIDAQLKDGALMLRGALSADHALFTLPDDGAPSLGDDVVVRHGTSAVAPAADAPSRASNAALDLAVDLDLGDDFQVRGRGMETRLAGRLELVVNGGRAPQLTGTVRSVQGNYRAYGQKLDIERGLIRFTGALDNPALDVLAIRPQLTQRVGVQITGTVLSPIVALYAEPDLPDAEKLAWLVLGRSPSGSGAEAALMQQAAMALLGGNGKGLSESLGSALGLDELSLRSSTESGDNTGTAAGASITLGKRLSGDFYIAYERSLNSAVGVFSIFYDLSKRLTLRAQTGEQSTIDLIYTVRYD